VDKEFRQLEWNAELREDWQRLLDLAVRLDLDRFYDWTSSALVPRDAEAQVAVVARQDGVVAGLPAAEMVVEQSDRRHCWTARRYDGDRVQSGEVVVLIEGPARNLFTCERLMLNVLGHLSGIATLTDRYVQATKQTNTRIYDTRKTTPGWRRLEKYAVRCGGGNNHRTGLYDAVLIKDNHLAFGRASHGSTWTAADAVREARAYLKDMLPPEHFRKMIVEVELDDLDTLDDVLRAKPDLILLDNMTPDELRQAVRSRDQVNAAVEMEASGGVHLESVEQIAATGVERISVGALTHSAATFDFSLDWRSA